MPPLRPQQEWNCELSPDRGRKSTPLFLFVSPCVLRMFLQAAHSGHWSSFPLSILDKETFSLGWLKCYHENESGWAIPKLVGLKHFSQYRFYRCWIMKRSHAMCHHFARTGHLSEFVSSWYVVYDVYLLKEDVEICLPRWRRATTLKERRKGWWKKRVTRKKKKEAV